MPAPPPNGVSSTWPGARASCRGSRRAADRGPSARAFRTWRWLVEPPEPLREQREDVDALHRRTPRVDDASPRPSPASTSIERTASRTSGTRSASLAVPLDLEHHARRASTHPHAATWRCRRSRAADQVPPEALVVGERRRTRRDESLAAAALARRAVLDARQPSSGRSSVPARRDDPCARDPATRPGSGSSAGRLGAPT